jgi:hypothetical protein
MENTGESGGLKMAKSGDREAGKRAAHLRIDDLRLGETSLEFEVGSLAEASAVAQALAAQARRTLLLHTEDLEPAIYDESAFLDAVTRLSHAHSQSRIWILIQDSRKVVQHGHRLIEIARRLSSAIQLRRPAPQYRNYHESFLLADGCGYLHRPIAARYEGIANFYDPGKVAEFGKYFMEVWERSEPDEEIKRLYI